MKTTQAILISVYREPVVAEECATVTEKLGEYLISVGYWDTHNPNTQHFNNLLIIAMRSYLIFQFLYFSTDLKQ